MQKQNNITSLVNKLGGSNEIRRSNLNTLCLIMGIDPNFEMSEMKFIKMKLELEMIGLTDQQILDLNNYVQNNTHCSVATAIEHFLTFL